jgi:hypothetical protein
MFDRFHPATRRLKEIVESGELGTLTKIEANVAVPADSVKDKNVMVYELGGGVMMDMGCEFDCTIFPWTSRYDFSQATHYPCRDTCRAPILRKSSVPSRKYFRTALRLIQPPPLPLLFQIQGNVPVLGLPMG